MGTLNSGPCLVSLDKNASLQIMEIGEAKIKILDIIKKLSETE